MSEGTEVDEQPGEEVQTKARKKGISCNTSKNPEHIENSKA